MKTTEEPDKPPIMGSWNKVYSFVLILHIIIIVLFYLITKAYA